MKPILKHEISNKREHSQRLGLQLMILPVALLGLAFAATNPLCSKITIRKEANDVSDSEWRMIVDTIQKAQRTPDSEDPTISVWEAGADLHKDLSANPSERIHDSCMFLFWHRVFLVEMEKNLQKINPDFFFPYWDSAKQWGDVENAPIWNYLGRKGSPVENDIFNNVPFKLPGEEKPLARSTEDWNKALFTAQFYDRLTRKSITDKTGFGVWHEDVEGSHGILHVEIGGSEGQMSMMASPLDPLF